MMDQCNHCLDYHPPYQVCDAYIKKVEEGRVKFKCEYCPELHSFGHVCQHKKKKNCLNCKWMEWESGDINDPEGFVCTKKYFSHGREEDEMLAKMARESYRKRAKMCCEIKVD